MQNSKLVPAVEQHPDRVTFAEYQMMVEALPQDFRTPTTTETNGVRTEVFKDANDRTIMTAMVDTRSRTVTVEIGQTKGRPLERSRGFYQGRPTAG